VSYRVVENDVVEQLATMERNSFDGCLCDPPYHLNAMGFPEWYEFEGNRSDKVRQIGNAVEIKTATALALSALAS
jgi:DNA modification methylase